MINKNFINERLLMINSFLKELYKLAELDEETFYLKIFILQLVKVF